MPNPNNNMNMYNQAVQINRDLKKRIDKELKIIDDFIEFDSNFKDEYEDVLEGLKEILNGR